MTFISLDGGEGVGKSTQMRLLQERLPALYPDREFVFTREPGGTELGEKIRSLIFEAADADGLTMFGLFAASRADHVRRVIKPALEAGKVVITDRYVAASCAYQMYAQENPISERLFGAHLLSLGALPELTILFDMEPEKSLKRIAERSGESTHFDTRTIGFHRKLRHGYRDYMKSFDGDSHDVQMIDADRPVEQVYSEIFAIIQEYLG